VVFRGSGRKFLQCDPGSNCNTSAASVSWVQEANIAFTKVRSESTYWDETKGYAQLDLQQGDDCRGPAFDHRRQHTLVGADKTAGARLQLTLQVPMAPIAGCDIIAVAAPGGKSLPPAQAKLLNVTWDIGRWDDWRDDTNKGASKSEGTYWRQTISPLSSDATYKWSGTIAVQEYPSGPPEETTPPPDIPKLASQPLKKGPEILPPPSPPPQQANPFLTAIITTIRKQVERLAGRTPQISTSAIPPADGRLTGAVSLIVAGRASSLATLRQPVRKGVATSVRLRFDARGLTSLKRLKKPARARISVVFDPDAGRTERKTALVTITPKIAKAAITSVTFSGGPANPTVAVRGTALGARPKPSPAHHPAGHSGCPSVAGDTGYDYGTSLYIENVTRGFAGGRYRPEAGELDCIDLVVTKFTSTEVDFHFGPFLTQNAAKFPFDPGDTAKVVVNGASRTVRVSYP
jgi:hypothetical protein